MGRFAILGVGMGLLISWIASNSGYAIGEPPDAEGNTGQVRARIGYDNTIYPLFQRRCALCHNASSSVPNWLVYSTAYQYRAEIYQKVVIDKTMPLGNATGMTDEERQIVGEWIQAGAPE